MGDGISFGFDFNWERNSGTRVFFSGNREYFFFYYMFVVYEKKKKKAHFLGV